MYNSVKNEIGKKTNPFFNPSLDNFGSYKDKKQKTNQKEGAKPKGFNFKNGAKGKPKPRKEPKQEDPGYTNLEILAAKARPYGGPTIRNHR